MATKRQLEGLTKKIEKWLSTRRKTDGQGGWAEIESKDIWDLHAIINRLIELKCEPDADGDFPINFCLTNRRHSHHIGANIPYHSSTQSNRNLSKEDALVRDVERLRILGDLCASALEQFNTDLRMSNFSEEHLRGTD